MKSKIDRKFEELQDEILKNHTLYSDRALAFYQGALWALVSVRPQLQNKYTALCKLDGRMQ